jgi:hypothetical protein
MKKKLITIIAGISILAGVITIIMLFVDNSIEKTDDAQIEQYISPVNVKVSGYIKEIRFTEHQYVHKGDTLMIIDDREYVIALQQAEAALIDARSGRKVVGNTVNTASTSAAVFESTIEEAELRVEKLQRDYDRYSRLLERKATTPVVVEQYRTELDMAKARVSALRRQSEAARSTVSEVNQRRENADAAIMRAEAAVDMARLNLSYTVITAPADGFLGRRSIEVGQLVNPGQTITTLMPDGSKWVVANFKETQMAHIRIGQKAEIHIDAMPGTVLNGTISAISSATGSKYSMIPTDNSAGNFVKIQQRIPVRIDFTDSISTELNRRMAAGMMCEIKVDVKENRNGE